jgi:dGTPase
MAKYSQSPQAGSLEAIQHALNSEQQQMLSAMAAHNTSALRRVKDPLLESGYRLAFSIDVDRILHSQAYARYIDKTQVFYLIKNDHITHRVLHVQLVSKIARTVGRFLRLNEDLIEAIALGHDIGHVPFGHDGESLLSALCLRQGIGHFLHNLQSVQFLDRVENRGRGWNLSLQCLDGILCHDGEIHNQKLEPNYNKTFKTLDNEVLIKKHNPAHQLVPMTMEGCVVRMADTISYIGRDIEDAIRLNMIRRRDLPPECVRVLGDTNGTIVYNLVTDIITNSHAHERIAFSPEVSEALRRLKRFNLEAIYLNPMIKQYLAQIEQLFEILFERYLLDIDKENTDSVIFSKFLADKSEDYRNAHLSAEIVRDFIAGMTDQYFLRQCPEHLRPQPSAV